MGKCLTCNELSTTTAFRCVRCKQSEDLRSEFRDGFDKMQNEIKDELLVHGSSALDEIAREKCIRCDNRFIVDEYEDIGVTTCPDCKRAMSSKDLGNLRKEENRRAMRIRAEAMRQRNDAQVKRREEMVVRLQEINASKETLAEAKEAHQAHLNETKATSDLFDGPVLLLSFTMSFSYLFFIREWFWLLSLIIGIIATLLLWLPLLDKIGAQFQEERVGLAAYRVFWVTALCAVVISLGYAPFVWAVKQRDHRVGMQRTLKLFESRMREETKSDLADQVILRAEPSAVNAEEMIGVGRTKKNKMPWKAKKVGKTKKAKEAKETKEAVRIHLINVRP